MDTSFIPSEDFFPELKSLYTATNTCSTTWACIAAVAFSGFNVPEAVPLIFECAQRHENVEGKLLVRRIREALFKSGLMYGFPKFEKGLFSPDPTTQLDETKKKGQALFDQLYGEKSPTVSNFLEEIHSDLGGDFFMKTIAYGYIYGYTDILSATETSLCIVAGAIVAGTAPQLVDHEAGARRNGASADEIEATKRIVVAVAKGCNVRLASE
ncbi:hypothetical protein AAF712_013393 [Marasmius tenuissimus]|uniref:Carboxymuconolactone decarboxylase-like domain-containing protein n=1 Tax=Marasmius tenuissimus TaxID=585030 RepID=A0ABR2ZGG4_9AGAR